MKRLITFMIAVIMCLSWTCCLSACNSSTEKQNTETVSEQNDANTHTDGDIPENDTISEDNTEIADSEDIVETVGSNAEDTSEESFVFGIELNEALYPIAEKAFNNTYNWEEQMTYMNVDYGYTARCEAFEYMKEWLEGGEIGSGNYKFWNTADYLFGEGAAEKYHDNVEEIYNLCVKYMPWFVDRDDYGHRSFEAIDKFLTDVSNMPEVQEYLSSVGGYFNYSEDYRLEFSYDDVYTEELAAIIGITPEAYFDILMRVAYFFDIGF